MGGRALGRPSVNLSFVNKNKPAERSEVSVHPRTSVHKVWGGRVVVGHHMLVTRIGSSWVHWVCLWVWHLHWHMLHWGRGMRVGRGEVIGRMHARMCGRVNARVVGGVWGVVARVSGRVMRVVWSLDSRTVSRMEARSRSTHVKIDGKVKLGLWGHHSRMRF